MNFTLHLPVPPENQDRIISCTQYRTPLQNIKFGHPVTVCHCAELADTNLKIIAVSVLICPLHLDSIFWTAGAHVDMICECRLVYSTSFFRQSWYTAAFPTGKPAWRPYSTNSWHSSETAFLQYLVKYSLRHKMRSSSSLPGDGLQQVK